MYANDDEKQENVTQCFHIEKWSDTFFSTCFVSHNDYNGIIRLATLYVCQLHRRFKNR